MSISTANNITFVEVKETKDGNLAEDRAAKRSNSETLYQRMMDEVIDYSIILLDPNGHITEWNKRSREDPWI